MSYSRKFLLSFRYCWKTSRYQVQSSCNDQHVKSSVQVTPRPLSSAVWNSLKSLGILRKFRGNRGGKHLKIKKSEVSGRRQIEPNYSTSLRIQNRPVSSNSSYIQNWPCERLLNRTITKETFVHEQSNSAANCGVVPGLSNSTTDVFAVPNYYSNECNFDSSFLSTKTDLEGEPNFHNTSISTLNILTNTFGAGNSNNRPIPVIISKNRLQAQLSAFAYTSRARQYNFAYPNRLQNSRNGNQVLSLCLLNSRSVRNKTAVIFDYVCDCKADLVAITETWLGDHDAAVRAELCPDGYKLLDQGRNGRRGGGTALIFRDSLAVKKVDAEARVSFEFSEWTVQSL